MFHIFSARGLNSARFPASNTGTTMCSIPFDGIIAPMLIMSVFVSPVFSVDPFISIVYEAPSGTPCLFFPHSPVFVVGSLSSGAENVGCCVRDALLVAASPCDGQVPHGTVTRYGGDGAVHIGSVANSQSRSSLPNCFSLVCRPFLATGTRISTLLLHRYRAFCTVMLICRITDTSK